MKFKFLKSLFALLKYKISIAVTFTAITSYVVYHGSLNLPVLFLAVGVFVLASGASALNQYQERDYDALMERTKHRPITTAAISAYNGLLISILFIFSGITILFFGCGLIPALLGLFNTIWYNFVYTTLKRISSFAVVPGSLVGAVPAFIGWTAAGGYLFSPTIIFIGFFLFIWQIPHFWLLMFKYSTEYEKAGYPTINRIVLPENLQKIIFSWIVATSFISILIPIFLIKLSFLFFVLVFVLNLLFITLFARLSFGKSTELNLKKSFISINIYMMLFMVLLFVFHLCI
jgi:heme o synthase